MRAEDALQALTDGRDHLNALLSEWPPERWDFRYAPGKWSVKEILLHLIDSERVFAYRALCIARGEQTPLPGFEQDDYVPLSGAEGRSPESLLEEYRAVREATLSLFRHLPEESLTRIGKASDNPLSARAAAWIIAGHEVHHLRVIEERYGGGGGGAGQRA